MNPAQELHETRRKRVTLQALSTGDLKNIERALKIDYSNPDSDKMAFFGIVSGKIVRFQRVGLIFFDENFEVNM